MNWIEWLYSIFYKTNVEEHTPQYETIHELSPKKIDAIFDKIRIYDILHLFSFKTPILNENHS